MTLDCGASALLALLSEERERAAVMAGVEAAQSVEGLAAATSAWSCADDLAPAWAALGRIDRALFRACRWAVHGIGGAYAMGPDDFMRQASRMCAASALHAQAAALYIKIAGAS